jgi:FkbM family methyltransferase
MMSVPTGAIHVFHLPYRCAGKRYISGRKLAMAQRNNWFGNLVLRSPAPIRSLRKVPVLGRVIHFLSHRILPTNERLCVQVQAGPAQGIHLELNPRTGEAYLRGEPEIAIQKMLVERLRPGMVFYDLGANIGFFSLLAARLVGATGRVFSFEPDAEVAARLRRNVELNEFSNITVVEAGVWSASENVRFVPSDATSPERGTGTFLADENQTPGTQTRCIALDDFIRTAPVPDAIKCDVEGAELEALRGASGLFQAQRPWIICELHSEANDRMVREFFGRLNYDVRTLDVNHIWGEPKTGS